MIAIFLDIDGVLNRHEKLATGYCGILPEHAATLNMILEEVPEAVLVISSAWRYMMLRGDMTLKGFEYLLLVNGIVCSGRIVGHTLADGDVCDEPPHWDVELWKQIGLRMRAKQIADYCAKNGVQRYVVIDDLPLDVPNLVQTISERGLTELEARRAIEILTATP